MITALDSSVIWAIFNREKGWECWVDALASAASVGTLRISSVAFAELAPAELNADKLAARLEKFAITYDTISPNSAYLAGTIFKRYRLAGGPRMHLIPDFLIAAHATIQADRLAAIDRGYLRSWFPNLHLLTPESPST